jgi:hypothetical protein
MRKFGSAVVAAAMLVSSASVAFGGTEDQGALASGGAAGVKEAQFLGCDPWMFGVAAVVVIGGVCLAICGNNSHSPSHTTSSTP